MMDQIMAKTNPHRSLEGTTAKFKSRGSGGKISGKDRYSGDQMMWVMLWSMKARPMVTMITEMMGAPMSCLRISLSMIRPSRKAKTRVPTKAIPEGCTRLGEDGDAYESAQGHESARGKVQNAGGFIDKNEPKGDQTVNAPGGQTGNNNLQKNIHAKILLRIVFPL